MRNWRFWFLMMAGLFFCGTAGAHINPEHKESKRAKDRDARVNFRENCDNAVAQVDMQINNVRARLTTGGDVWWDGDDGRYVVPKVPPGVPEVSSIFAGAVWLGGVDPAGNLKVAAQAYGRNNGSFDYYTGPLNPETGTTEQEVCSSWDQFFTVKGTSIETHLRNFEAAQTAGEPLDPDEIPLDVKGWPAKGNQFFFEVHGFDLPNTTQGLAGFWDQDGDGDYNPELGDYPVIEIRGCTDKPQFPDDMTFWIYNDAGNIHRQTQGDPIQMEVQVQAFAYATNDEINDMTFQRYKLINRAVESIDSTFFAMWIDPDLGCYTDDYIGCDTLRSLAFVYNEDALDGTTGCICEQGVNTYCESVPILGVDYFRGPLDENGDEIGLSSFTYFNNGGIGSPPPGTTDPTPGAVQEYYNYLSGSWRDGSPFTFGDDAYQDGFPIKYAFTEAPDDPDGWSMCTANLPFGDRRTVQASGPFRLDPGAVNELIIGAVWVADQEYPCPSIVKLQEADDIAQALFDNCFEITDGPDAPDVDFIELDQEIIAVFTNDTLTSNNAFESYAQRGLQIPAGEADSLYRFEGYKFYQLSGPNVTIADLDDPSKARLIYQVDLQNGVGEIYNWETVPNPTSEEVYVPTLEVAGRDEGLRNTFRITEDQFAEGDRRLINHKKYYFTAIAYAYNNYRPFDPDEVLGQRQPYLEGRRNIGDGENPFYTVLPRPILDRQLQAGYGDGAIITRIDGGGTGENFLDVADETREAIVNGTFNGEVTYESGRGPVEVQIFNPLDVVDGEYELRIIDDNLDDDNLEPSARWELTNLSDPMAPVIISNKTIESLNEQIIREYGFSIALGQVENFASSGTGDNGVIGAEIEYEDPNAEPWLRGLQEGELLGGTSFLAQITDFIANNEGEPDFALDQDQALNNIGNGFFFPYGILNYRVRDAAQDAPYIMPTWSSISGMGIVRNQTNLSQTNNVDIVFTSNKDLWSRCVVVEAANRYYEQAGYLTEGERSHFELRAQPSVLKEDNDGDGRPDPGTIFEGEREEGMGWFPGYAIDVETGQRLNVFFAENSVYNGELIPDEPFTVGGDMMFNPNAIELLGISNIDLFPIFLGGQHFVYVTKQPYDSCQTIANQLRPSPSAITKVRAVNEITWAGLVYAQPGEQLLSYDEGLIPEDVTVKLRVQNPYRVEEGTGANNGYPTYRFRIDNKEPLQLDQVAVDNALDQINVVPNPYYGFSDYETSQFTTIVKITNLPAQCTVNIYTLDGKFIRRYNRDEVGQIPVGNNRAIDRQQITPDLEWDLRNSRGIPIASGVYLIHIAAPGLGERTIKWFGVNRKFDPSGL